MCRRSLPVLSYLLLLPLTVHGGNNFPSLIGDFRTNQGDEIVAPYVVITDVDQDGRPESLNLRLRVHGLQTRAALGTIAGRDFRFPVPPAGCDGQPSDYSWHPAVLRAPGSTRIHVSIRLLAGCWDAVNARWVEMSNVGLYSVDLSSPGNTPWHRTLLGQDFKEMQISSPDVLRVFVTSGTSHSGVQLNLLDFSAAGGQLMGDAGFPMTH